MSRQSISVRINSGPMLGWFRCRDCGGVYFTEKDVQRHWCRAFRRTEL